VVPADAWLGIAARRHSPGVREMACREALHCSFEVAGDNLRRTAQLSMSGSSLRLLVEAEGPAIQAALLSGMLAPGFTAADCTGQTLITGADGVMVPLVTEQQKQKRRNTQATKRAAAGRRSTARPGRPKRGADGPYKEFKLLTYYDADKTHRHVEGTSGDHEALGALMSRTAKRLEFGQAKHKYAVSDGAEWIARQYRKRLPMLDEHILDYFHLQEHVVQTSQVLYGVDTPAAKRWRDETIDCVWERGPLAMLDRLSRSLQAHRDSEKRQSLSSLHQYVGKRVSMTDYPLFRQHGYDCGSGPTESCCGTLTSRLKGPGMRWDKDNAESLMALAGVYHSNLWRTYWASVRMAA
jgi:hypothetical protein